MIEVGCQISIKKDGFCFLDPFKVDLLLQIEQCGSLSAAAKELSVSYQHAWTLIDEMNRSAPSPLVAKQRGGAHGGGAVITAYGEQILTDYRLIEAKIKKLISQINVEINY